MNGGRLNIGFSSLGLPEADCGTMEGALGWESSPWALDQVLCSTAWSWASQSPSMGLSIRTLGFPGGSEGKESACNVDKFFQAINIFNDFLLGRVS